MSNGDLTTPDVQTVVTDLTKNQVMADNLQQAIGRTTTFYTLVLKPVQNGPFAAQYDLQVSNLELPQQINLAATT